MYPPKQSKEEKRKKVQALYREKKRGHQSSPKEFRVGTIGSMAIGVCVLLFVLYFIMGFLFDMGVPVPEIFGR
ncbi:conserved hypothetical protein [Bacillus sp. 349Y]|nr:conserved hypothetical protein [Bacillus sp. 349Y]